MEKKTNKYYNDERKTKKKEKNYAFIILFSSAAIGIKHITLSSLYFSL